MMFDHINQLYEKEKSLLIDTILKYNLRKESAKENSSKPFPSRKESAKENTSKPSLSTKESSKENTSKPSLIKGFLWTIQTELVKQIFTPTKQIRMQKNVHVMKQGAAKKNMLE